jgi:aspartokinase
LTTSEILGGFKVLQGMAGFSLVSSEKSGYSPAEICRAIARKRINLSYLSLIHSPQFWGLYIIIDPVDGPQLTLLIEETIGNRTGRSSSKAVVSLFPHKNNPDITGRLFEIFGKKDVMPDSMANSPSAISFVLKERHLEMIKKGLFESFTFSAYRTPEDWKLAQKGKEQVYKEVIASYREQRPKVYGLEYYDSGELFQVTIPDQHVPPLGTAFKGYAQTGLNLIFSSICPSEDKGKVLSFCLPGLTKGSKAGSVKESYPATGVNRLAPVALFSINGPHFGDRYGIASRLLTSFEENQIDLLCLNSTIASIVGVVPYHQLDSCIRAIKGCFDVPGVIKR